MRKKLTEVAHEMANDLYDAGVIDAVTMREYDALCILLEQPSLNMHEIVTTKAK